MDIKFITELLYVVELPAGNDLGTLLSVVKETLTKSSKRFFQNYFRSQKF